MDIRLSALLSFFVGVTCFWQASHAAEFFVLPDTTSLLMLGDTHPDDVEEFIELIEVSSIDTIILRGPGGALEAAFSIATEVQRRGLNTVVAAGSDCASACALIFIAGASRHMEEGSRLGFHMPFLGRISQEELEAYCSQSSYLEQVEADQTYGGVLQKCLYRTYQQGLLDMSRFARIMRYSNVSDAVFGAMVATPSQQIFWFAATEAEALNLTSSPN
jgi:hypothetical protein